MMLKKAQVEVNYYLKIDSFRNYTHLKMGFLCIRHEQWS